MVFAASTIEARILESLEEASLALKHGVRSVADVDTDDALEDFKLTSFSSIESDVQERDGEVRFRVNFSEQGPEVREVSRYIHLLDLPDEEDLQQWRRSFINGDSDASEVVDMTMPQDEFEAELGPPCSFVPMLLGR